MVKQLFLFDQSSFNILQPLKQTMAKAAKECGMSREEICEQMNNLAERHGIRLMKGNGRYLNVTALEKWLNPMDTERVIILKALPIFCAVVDSEKPMLVMVKPLGFRLIGPNPTLRVRITNGSKINKLRLSALRLWHYFFFLTS